MISLLKKIMLFLGVAGGKSKKEAQIIPLLSISRSSNEWNKFAIAYTRKISCAPLNITSEELLLNVSDFTNEWNTFALNIAENERTAINPDTTYLKNI